VLRHRGEIGRSFEIAANFDAELAKMADRISAERTLCSERAQRLSSKRRELTPKLGGAVGQELAKLGIANARFEVVVGTKSVPLRSAGEQDVYVRLGTEAFEANTRGIDLVEFALSTNAGEDPKPLVKVASGGEISRVMLAMKSILAKADRLPLLVFDEIDTGISGRIAAAVGKSLKGLSGFHQIIAITHLPQIAGFADWHYAAEKHEANGRTSSRLRQLSDEERVREVARLMSGDEVTEAGMSGARELIQTTNRTGT
jgi:DNA repair protein RecN (Recombination protein N)